MVASYLTSQSDDTDSLAARLLYMDDSLANISSKQNTWKGSSLALVGKAYDITLTLLLVGACSEAWWAHRTNNILFQ